MSRSRNFTFTWNNYNVNDVNHIKELTGVRYVVFGFETASTGTKHLQGQICLDDGKTLPAFRKWFQREGRYPHIELTKDLQASITYCKKEGDFFERGEAPLGPDGMRADNKKRWKEALDFAREGRFEEIDPMIQITQCRNLEYIYNRGLRKLPLEDTTCRMLWLHGPSGTGKSRAARERYPNAYLKLANKWWDGYNNENVVILEDFDVNHAVLCHHLKIWGDRYPFPAEVKCSAIRIRPKLLIVTSNWHPKEIWTNEQDLQPILRRFHCIEFTKEFKPIIPWSWVEPEDNIIPVSPYCATFEPMPSGDWRTGNLGFEDEEVDDPFDFQGEWLDPDNKNDDGRWDME